MAAMIVKYLTGQGMTPSGACNDKGLEENSSSPLRMAPGEGFEPPAKRLTAYC